MDPVTAGLMVGGSVISGLSQPKPVTQYTGLQSKAQLDLINQMVRMMQQGGGEFGFGQAARSGNETLMNSLASRGINQNSGVGTSALAQMLAQATAQDAGNRRMFGLQAAQAQAPTINYQKLGEGWEGVPGYGMATKYRGPQTSNIQQPRPEFGQGAYY